MDHVLVFLIGFEQEFAHRAHPANIYLFKVILETLENVVKYV